MGKGVVGVEVAALRQEALRYYDDAQAEAPVNWAAQPLRPGRADVVHAGPFDGARFVAAAEGGELAPWLLTHINVQRATRMSESLGAFDNQVDIPFVNGWLINLGERELWNRLRSTMAAFAMAQADPGFDFNVRRNLYEHHNKSREEAMMRDAPVGTVMGLFSPCEPGAYGRRLGMFPDREMATLQLSWKKSEDTMALRVISLDRASLGILRQLLAEQGVEVAADAAPEDYLAYIFERHCGSQQELDEYVQGVVARFDELVLTSNPELVLRGEQPRQGVIGYDARNMHSTLDMIVGTSHGQLALRQEHKLDVLLADHVHEPRPLAPVLRRVAEQSMRGLRSDGRAVLSPAEAVSIHKLLSAKMVSLDDPEHAKALELITIIHNSAIEKSFRNFVSGNKRAMDWMLPATIEVGDVPAMIGAAIWAIEDGQGSAGCGGEVKVGDYLPNYRLNPNGYLIAVLGRENVQWGTCDSCHAWPKLVGKCKPAFCGGCHGARVAKAKGRFALFA